MIRRQLGRLHRDDRGQIMIFTMFALVGFVLMLSLLVNTGSLVVRRTRMQNAADAAAVTQASWAARTLNLMSMNNVGLAQTFSVFMITEAFAEATLDAAGKIAQRMATASRFLANVCSNITAVVNPLCYVNSKEVMVGMALEAQLAAIELAYGAISWGLPTSVKLMNAYSAMNEHLAEEFPRFTQRIAAEMSAENGPSDVLFYSPFAARKGERVATTLLPVREGWVVDLCNAAQKGSSSSRDRDNFRRHRHRAGRGPLTEARRFPSEVLARELSIGDVWQAFGKLFQLRSGGEALPTVLEGLPGPLYLMSSNFPLWFPTPPYLTNPPGSLAPITYAPYYRSIPLPSQVPGRNIYEEFLDRRLGQVCNLPPLRSWSSGALATAIPFRVMVLDAAVELTPILTDRVRLRNDLSVVAVARRETTGGPAARAAYDTPPGQVYAWAQARVYNTVSYDLYTQAWDARLDRAYLLEDDGEREQLAKELGRRDGFQALGRALARMRSEDIEAVNVH